MSHALRSVSAWIADCQTFVAPNAQRAISVPTGGLFLQIAVVLLWQGPTRIQLKIFAWLPIGSVRSASSRSTFHPIREILMSKVATATLVCAVALAWAGATHAASTTTYRNSQGKTVGSASTSGNKTTFRDASGRTTGTVTRSSSGTTTYRNSSGKTMGTSKRR
jgi:hypothetical protein